MKQEHTATPGHCQYCGSEIRVCVSHKGHRVLICPRCGPLNLAVEPKHTEPKHTAALMDMDIDRLVAWAVHVLDILLGAALAMLLMRAAK